MRIALMMFLTLVSCQLMSHVQIFTLDNGLKVVVKEDHRAPVAVSLLWYHVGSADEPAGLTGVSHALEHMMFKGTPKFPRGVFSKTIAEMGGQENAITNYDFTVFFEKIAANHLPVVFELEADRMQNLLFDNDEWTKEIQVIREERRQRTDDNPKALALERYLATAHLTPAYQHPVIGWMNDLYQIKRDDLKQWYQTFYAPNNATLVVVGDVNPKQVHAWAMTYFGKITKGSTYTRRAQHEPTGLGAKFIEIQAPASLPMLMLGYTVPSVKTAEKAWEPYALELIAGILDAGESGRFAKNLIRRDHVAGGASVSYNLYSRYQTQFIMHGIPTQSSTVKDLKLSFLNEIKALKTNLVSQEELQRIKTQIIAQNVFEKDSMFSEAMELGMLETLGLGYEEAEHYTQKINQITPLQIRDVAKRYFSDLTQTEAVLIPLANEASV